MFINETFIKLKMSFLIRNNELQEKYENWIKVSNSIKKEFDNEPIDN